MCEEARQPSMKNGEIRNELKKRECSGVLMAGGALKSNETVKLLLA
jgi:triosephosphate isomerase